MASAITGVATAAAINTFSSEKYVKYDDQGVEPEVPNEEGLEKELHEIISRVIARNFSKHRHGFRATHVKTQGIVKGTFTVSPSLPEHLAQGICSPSNANRTHPIAIRFANEPSFLQDDRAPGPRGLGLKIFDVSPDSSSSSADSFLDPAGARTKTQDMTFNNSPALELRDLPTTVDIFRIREANFDDPDEIAAQMKKRKDATLQMAPTQLPNQHFLSYTMYSQSAYRWGPYVAKYALFPSTQMQSDLASSAQITSSSSPEQHSQWLRDFFATHSAEYELRIQLCQSLREQAVEDTGLPWDETAFPFQTVGTVTIPAGQDSFDAKRRTFWEDSMKCNVWYGLESMRPLGSVNRLRRNLYKMSVAKREETNVTEVKYVDSIDQIP